MKRLILITNKLTGGGAERVMSVIANDFVERGIEVIFLVLKETPIEYSLDSRIKFIYKNDEKSKDSLGQIRFIRTVMKRYPGATVLSFFTHQNLYTIVASIGLKNRVIVSERNDPAYSIQGKLKKIIRKFLYACRLCDGIVFQTSEAANYFSRKIQLKSVVIPNPMKRDLPHMYEGVRKNTIVSFGRFEEQKNYEMLILAFSKFVAIYSDYKLFLYGKGSQLDALIKNTNQLKIADKVTFSGFSQNVHEEVIDAGMFVLSSNYEGLSNSMIEAMAIGLPVICTDCPSGGARTYIKNKINGLLVPVGNVKALTEAMIYMVENKQQAYQMGREAYKIRTELNEEKICSQWENMLFV